MKFIRKFTQHQVVHLKYPRNQLCNGTPPIFNGFNFKNYF